MLVTLCSSVYAEKATLVPFKPLKTELVTEEQKAHEANFTDIVYMYKTELSQEEILAHYRSFFQAQGFIENNEYEEKGVVIFTEGKYRKRVLMFFPQSEGSAASYYVLGAMEVYKKSISEDEAKKLLKEKGCTNCDKIKKFNPDEKTEQ